MSTVDDASIAEDIVHLALKVEDRDTQRRTPEESITRKMSNVTGQLVHVLAILLCLCHYYERGMQSYTVGVAFFFESVSTEKVVTFIVAHFRH